MKLNNTNLGKFYNTDRRTIAGYRKHKPKIYEALKRYFISEHKDTQKLEKQ